MATRKIKVGIVDDHALFRSGLANLLRELKDIDVAFEAADGNELADLLPLHKDIDVVLMDINMPGKDGYDSADWVKQHFPLVHILALSMFDDDVAIIKMLKAGARGYILKDIRPPELYRAIQTITETGVYLNDTVSGKMLRSLQDEAGTKPDQVSITERERQFLKLCVSELTYKEIARQMNVAVRTVDNYRESLFEKLELKSRVGLVLYALRQGITEL